MQHRMLMAAILICGLAGGNAQAASLKIAYVDMRSAIVNTTSYKDGMKRLNEKKARIEKELKALGEKIRKAQENLESKAMAMKPGRLAQMQEDISTMQKQGKRKVQDANEEMARERRRLEQGAGAAFHDAVQKYAKSKGYDIILRKQFMLFGSSQYDVTADITKLINKKK